MIEVINRSNKELVPLEFNYREDVKDTDASYYAEGIGKLPLVVINGVQIESRDIQFFRLSNEEFLPVIEIIFEDPTNKLIDSQYPLDLQICSILIKSNESLLMPLRMDFWINKFITVKNKGGDSDKKKYHLIGDLNVIKVIKNDKFKGSSYDVLKTLSEKADLGFASNIDKTNDSMTWINIGIENIREFVPEVVRHGYIDDNTFVWAYVDFWYNLNYVDIEKQLNHSTKEDRSLSGNESVTGKKDTIPLIVSNHPDYNMTNQYFEKFNLINESTDVNWNIGYKPWVYYYQTKEKNMVGVLLDTLSYQGDNKDKIVLKGQPDDNAYDIDQQRNYFMGKNDTDNSHENYLYAELLNTNNLKFLQKVRMSIVLKKLNFQLYRFQPVNIQIYKTRELDSNPNPVTQQERESGKNMDKYKLNERLSGDWLITGINFTYVRKGNSDQMMQEIIVAKRELSAAKVAKNN